MLWKSTLMSQRNSHISSSFQGQGMSTLSRGCESITGCSPAPMFTHHKQPSFGGTDANSRVLGFLTSASSMPIYIFFEGPELLLSSWPRGPLFLLSCKPTKSVQELLRLQLEKQPAPSGRRREVHSREKCSHPVCIAGCLSAASPHSLCS